MCNCWLVFHFTLSFFFNILYFLIIVQFHKQLHFLFSRNPIFWALTAFFFARTNLLLLLHFEMKILSIDYRITECNFWEIKKYIFGIHTECTHLHITPRCKMEWIIIYILDIFFSSSLICRKLLFIKFCRNIING